MLDTDAQSRVESLFDVLGAPPPNGADLRQLTMLGVLLATVAGRHGAGYDASRSWMASQSAAAMDELDRLNRMEKIHA